VRKPFRTGAVRVTTPFHDFSKGRRSETVARWALRRLRTGAHRHERRPKERRSRSGLGIAWYCMRSPTDSEPYPMTDRSVHASRGTKSAARSSPLSPRKSLASKSTLEAELLSRTEKTLWKSKAQAFCQTMSQAFVKSASKSLFQLDGQ
jgi:hypothetical protein